MNIEINGESEKWDMVYWRAGYLDLRNPDLGSVRYRRYDFDANEENHDRNWIIEMAIYPTGHSGDDYLIQIDENKLIRTRFGTRNESVVSELSEDFFSEVRNEEESLLSIEELQVLLYLAQELEAAGGIMELDIAEGSWEVVLIYNGVMYGMDYWRSDFEVFRRLIDEIIRLSPIQIELHSWS